MSKKGRLAHEETRFANLLKDTVQDLGDNIPGIHRIQCRLERDRRKRSAVTHGKANKSLRRNKEG